MLCHFIIILLRKHPTTYPVANSWGHSLISCLIICVVVLPSKNQTSSCHIKKMGFSWCHWNCRCFQSFNHFITLAKLLYSCSFLYWNYSQAVNFYQLFPPCFFIRLLLLLFEDNLSDGTFYASFLIPKIHKFNIHSWFLIYYIILYDFRIEDPKDKFFLLLFRKRCYAVGLTILLKQNMQRLSFSVSNI